MRVVIREMKILSTATFSRVRILYIQCSRVRPTPQPATRECPSFAETLAVAILANAPRARPREVVHGVRLLGGMRGGGVHAANKRFTLRHTPFARERYTGNVDLVNGARRTSWTRGRRTTSRRSAAGPGHPVGCPGTHRPPCTHCHVKRAPNFSPELHGSLFEESGTLWVLPCFRTMPEWIRSCAHDLTLLKPLHSCYNACVPRSSENAEIYSDTRYLHPKISRQT